MAAVNDILLAGFLLVISATYSSSACDQPKNLPTGATWVPNANCTSGKVYCTVGAQRRRCHCWGHCGYICERPNGNKLCGGGGGGGSGGGGGGKKTTKKPSPCPFGGVWYNPKTGQKCKCQSFNKKPFYLCGPSNSSNSTSPGQTTPKPSPTQPAAGSTPKATTPQAATPKATSPMATTPKGATPAPTTAPGSAPATPAPTPAPTPAAGGSGSGSGTTSSTAAPT